MTLRNLILFALYFTFAKSARNSSNEVPMPIYEYACGCGHRFERLARIADAEAPSPPCPACGAAGGRRMLSAAALLGRAAPPPGREAAPRSWEQVNHGDRDTIRHWQRTLEQRGKLEERYPELAGDSRPVLAHEGRYAATPLRAGEPALPPPTAGDTPAPPPHAPALSPSAAGDTPAPQHHGHHHPHAHPHPHAPGPAPSAGHSGGRSGGP